MQVLGVLTGGAAMLFSATVALADDPMSVAGRRVQVTDDGIGSATLTVDGAVLHQDGVIYLDPEPVTLDGVTVLTGSAGPGGNACNATPIVVVLPESGAPEFWGPVDSCAYFTPKLDGAKLVFASDAVPGTPGETWIWTRDSGFVPGPPVGFVADLGWEAMETLAGAHPAEAMAISPVLEALQSGLDADYPVFAERISGLGSGDLTREGYLGEACLKLSCEADWAVLYIDGATQQPFVTWHVTGEIEYRIWPNDTNLWPSEAMAVLRDKAAVE